MAEIIGIVSGLVNISETGFRISKILYNFGKSVFKAKEQINELARELDSISSAFQCLADVLETSEGLLKPALLNTTQAILDDCERTYAEIDENIHAVEGQSLRAKERAQWAFRKAKVKQLRTRLESAKATLSLMVNILNLSAGIKFLRGQNKPSEDLVEDTRQQFETSTQSVVDTQLAFDKAEEYEKRLADQDGSRNKRRLNSSSSQSNSQSHALVKAQPIGDIAAEIPGFELLSLVRWNETRQDGYDSEDSQDGDDETLARYDDLKRQAPAIVRRLCDGWTGLDQENLQGHGRILEHPSAGDEADDSNLESNLENASEAEASRPPKLRGLSLYDANQDEAPARFSSYSNGASRRENEGPNPMSKSAQNSPRLRKEGNESRWDPFSSFLPERSEYTSSGKTPRPGISLGPRSDRAKGRAFGDSITSDQKQDFSRRSKKNTTRGSGDEFGLQAQSEMLDSLDESDFSKIYAREHMPPRRSARRRSPNSRIKKDLDLLNDQVDNVNWDCLTFPTMDSGPPVREPQVPFHWFNPTMQSGSAGAKWEVVTQQRPVAAVPPQHSDSDRCCRLYLWPHHYGSNFSRYGEIVLHLDQFSISSGDLTLGDLHDKVFRLVPGSFVSTKLLSIQGGAQLPYSSEAANKAGLMNGSILLCLASAHNSPATEGAITLVWNSMVLKAKELQSKGEPYQYSASARLIPMIPKVWN